MKKKMVLPTDGTTISYSQRFIPCRHLCCITGKGHGPYWHASWRDNGKVLSCYVGKKLTEVQYAQYEKQKKKKINNTTTALQEEY